MVHAIGTRGGARRRPRHGWRTVAAATLALVGASLVVAPTTARADDPTLIVYRADTRSPAEVRRTSGFVARGIMLHQPGEPFAPDMSLYNHARGIPEDPHPSYTGSGYVGTFSTFDAARRWLGLHHSGTGYIYQIRASGNFIDVEESLRQYAPYPREGEVAVMSYIHISQVLGWQQYVTGLGSGYESNPAYDRRYDRSRGAGARPDLAGFPAHHEAWRQQPWSERSRCQASSKKSSSVECVPLLTNLEAARDFWIDFRDESPMVAPIQIQAATLASSRVRNLWWLLIGDRLLKFRTDDGAVLSNRLISEEWPALQETPFARGIDAMTQNPEHIDEYWLFREDKVATYAAYSDTMSRSTTISHAFPGLAGTPMRHGIDAVVSTGNSYELAFFRGDLFEIYNTVSGKTVGGGSLKEYWTALSRIPDLRIDAVVEGSTPGQYKFFAGNDLIDYDDRKASPTATISSLQSLDELRPWLVDLSLHAESCDAPSIKATGAATMPTLNVQVATARNYGQFIDAVRDSVAGARVYKDIRALRATGEIKPLRLTTKSGQVDLIVSADDLRIVGWYNPTQNTYYALAGRKSEYLPNYYSRPYWMQLDSDPSSLEAAAGVSRGSLQLSRSTILNAAETLRKTINPNPDPTQAARALLTLTSAISGASKLAHVEDLIEASWTTSVGSEQRREILALENRWEELSVWVHQKINDPATRDVTFPSTALASVDSVTAADHYLRLIRTDCT